MARPVGSRQTGAVPEPVIAAPAEAAQVRPYVSAEQLAALTPWSQDAIEKMIRRGVFKRGVHYFQPLGQRSRLIFKWDAIVALIEGVSAPDPEGILLESEQSSPQGPAFGKQVIDVEEATTSLQRLLA